MGLRDVLEWWQDDDDTPEVRQVPVHEPWGQRKRLGQFSRRNYVYNGGVAMTTSGVVMKLQGSITVADNAVSYVERTYDGTVSTNTVGFTQGTRIPMAKVTASNGLITRVEDWRPVFGPFPYYVVQTGEIGVTDVSYPVGNVLRYGADRNVSATTFNNLPAFQRAVDSVAALGTALGSFGGKVTVPTGRYRWYEVAGKGLVLPDGIVIEGETKIGVFIIPSGVWTDSIVRGASRDDNTPDVFERVRVSNMLFFYDTASPGRCIDATGIRNSVFENIHIYGNGTGVVGQIGLNVGEWNPAHTSRKSCYFNDFRNFTYDNINTCLRFDEDSNTSNNIFYNHNGFCRVMIDATDSTEGMGSVFERGYFLGDNDATSAVFKLPGGSMDMKTLSFGVFINWDWEFFQLQPTGSRATTAMRVDIRDGAEFARLATSAEGYFSVGGTDSPLVPADLSDAFVVSGYTVVGGAPGTVVLNPGVAYNRHRAASTGGGVLAVTNTGGIHTEYVVLDTSAETQRGSITLAPAGTDLVIADITVSAAGLVTGITDRRVFYPNLQLRGISGTATRAKNLRGLAVAVGAGAVFVDVVFGVAEANAQFGVYVSPRWNTTTWISNYTVNGFRVNFGTAAPGGGSFLDWLMIR